MTIERWRPFGSSLARWDPFHGLAEIQQEMNRLFDSLVGRPMTAPATERIWAPVADMYETKDDIVVCFELPGVREKEVSVTIAGDVLTVKGERRWEREAKDESLHRVERAYGRFERSVQLPAPVQVDRVKATYRDGVLEVRLPKAEALKAREIKIDVL